MILQNINEELLVYLNSLTQFDFIKSITIIFSDFPIFFLPIFLIFYWIHYTYKKTPVVVSDIHITKNLLEKENLLYIVYSVIIWIIISLTIQQFIHIDRPETALEAAWNLILNHLPSASFPSDHATVSVAFLSSLFFAWYKKTWLYFSPFVILMLLSRIMWWVHWPFDILAWSIVWYFSSYITFKYITNIKLINKLNQLIIKTMSYIKL